MSATTLLYHLLLFQLEALMVMLGPLGRLLHEHRSSVLVLAAGVIIRYGGTRWVPRP